MDAALEGLHWTPALKLRFREESVVFVTKHGVQMTNLIFKDCDCWFCNLLSYHTSNSITANKCFANSTIYIFR